MIGTRNADTYQGHETFTTSLRMSYKMHKNILFCLFLLFIILFMASFRWTASHDTYLSMKYIASSIYGPRSKQVFKVKKTSGGKKIRMTTTQVKRSKWIRAAHQREMAKLKKNAAMLGIACVLFYPLVLVFFRRKSVKQSAKKHIRGSQMITPAEFKAQARKNGHKLGIPMGDVAMPEHLEQRHTNAVGKSGTGKSQFFRHVLKYWIKHNRPGIVHDCKGEYFSEFFRPGIDMLFNPLDTRNSVNWNIFNGLITYPDVDANASSLIPQSISTTDPFWNDAARGVYGGILHHLYQSGKRNNKHLWDALCAEAMEIATMLKHTKGGEAGYRYITQNAENSRQAESVLAVMMQYTKCFEYMADIDGDFSVTDWLNNGRGIIYITNYEDLQETLKPILSLFIDLVGRKLLSMPDDESRKILFGLDEFGSLQRLPTIVNLLAKGRSKGACVFLGIQDDGQISKIYSKDIRNTIENVPGNRVIFPLTGETADREAKVNIGEAEHKKINRSMSMGPHDMRDGVSMSEIEKTNLLIMPGEISAMPDLTAIVRFRGYDFVKSKWKYDKPKPKIDPFIMREDLLLENIKLKQPPPKIKKRKQSAADKIKLNI